MQPVTIPQVFLDVTTKFQSSEKPVYLKKVHGDYIKVSYAELRKNVEGLSHGLAALGVKQGDRIGIVSENRVEWAIADFAITALGAIDVPVFPTLTDTQLEYIFTNCGANVIIVSNTLQYNKLLKVTSTIPTLETIIVMNNDVTLQSDEHKYFYDVIADGARRFDEKESSIRFESYANAVREDDLCTIIYTSGTTGFPKGVMLTHKNLISNVIAAQKVVPLDETDIFLSYLPMCHAYERIAGYLIAFAYGGTTAFAESLETVRTNLKEVQPTIMTSVPRLFERIRNGVLAKVEKDSPSKRTIFSWSITVGTTWLHEKQSGHVRVITRLKYALADKLVFSKIRELTGGRLRFFVSGGGALPTDVNEFFQMLGMSIIEGYGLTESSPVLTVTRLDDNEIGTVGKPLFNVEIKIAEDGEILARGPNIMRGYWKDPQATAETIDEQGWLHTGDIGFINSNGNLKITDRKKNIFVNSGGKNIAPMPIENALTQSKYLDQILLIGERRDYCTALIVPDFDVLKQFAEAAGIQATTREALVANEQIQREVLRDINTKQQDFAKYERVRKIRLLSEPFTVENGMATPKLSIKRKVVEQHYEKHIQSMYADEHNDAF